MKKFKYILDETSVDYGEMGGKAAALCRLAVCDVRIPEWFVISPRAFWDSRGVKDIDDVRMNDQIMVEVTEALKKFDESTLFAVRSSAIDEDGASNSFAGQLESYLYVSRDKIEENILKVFKSSYSERVMIYRKENKIDGEVCVPAVIIQKMVNARVAGVAFAVNPVTENIKETVVSAVYGLGCTLVDGEVDADTYVVSDRNEIKTREIGHKEKYAFGTEEGLRVAEVEAEKKDKEVMNHDEIIEVANLVRKSSKHFARFQDIEWAYEEDTLYLLQSRPITSLGRVADPSAGLNLWDNSNIVESYGGITTPMTFSFIQKAYESVYREMCILFNVSEKKIEENNLTFKRMLGLIDGRVYYNLFSWYRVLAILPGFAVNRKFMEQMMGVKKELPEEFMSEFKASTGNEKFKDSLDLGFSFVGLLKSLYGLDMQIRKFYIRLNEALKEKELSSLRLDELAGYYYELEGKLLKKWDAPLVNDFFAMIFYGVLKNMCNKIDDAEQKNLHNDLLCGEGGIISSEPAKMIKKLANDAKVDMELVRALCEGSEIQINKVMEKHPKLKLCIQEHVNKFGDRCLEELKLESSTLHDSKMPLYRAIGSYATRLLKGNIESVDETKIRKEAEKKIDERLKYKTIKKLMFIKVLNTARKLVKNRENLRFERTRLFGRVRNIMIEIGIRLASFNVINDARDVFYLEIDEVLGFVDGTGTTKDLRGLIEVRKKEYESYAESTPAERFETRGAVNIGNDFISHDQPVAKIEGDSIKGLGCSKGIVTAKVRIVKDPRESGLQEGEILVAERTDPGWIMLFPLASGIIVDRGSLLSHSAIVSREMGIPAIVSVTGIMDWLKDGDVVTMDGSTGVVTKIREEVKIDEK